MSTATATKLPPEVQAMMDAMKKQVEEAAALAVAAEARNRQLAADLEAARKAAKPAGTFVYRLTTYSPQPGKDIQMVEFSGTCKPKQLSVSLVRQILDNAEGIRSILPTDSTEPSKAKF